MTVLMGSQAATNDREQRGYRWLFSGIMLVAAAVTPLQGARAIVPPQEQPSHPLPIVRAGIPAQNMVGQLAFVKGTHDAALERDRGRNYLWPGVQGPNVGAPGLRAVVVPQEQPPPLPGSRLFGGVQTAPLLSTVAVTPLLSRQESPSHPGPLLSGGSQGAPAASAAVAVPLLLRQEQPFHPASWLVSGFPAQVVAGQTSFVRGTHADALQVTRNLLWPGVTSLPSVVSPEYRALTTRQEQPYHPGSQFYGGVQTAVTFVAPPALVTRLESPHHPLPYVSPGSANFGFFAAVSMTMLQDGALQEQPAQPAPVLRSGAATVQVAAGAERRHATTVQELPAHPSSLLRPGVQGPNVASGVTAVATTRQEAPWHPQPYTWSAQLYVAPTFLQPEMRRVVTTREQPYHPSPWLRSGVQGPNVGTGITSSVVISPQYPGHPSSVLSSGVQGPNVATAERRAAITTREQPSHPFPFVQAGTAPASPVLPGRRWVVVGQEQPSHPGSRLWSGVPPVLVALSPGRRVLLVGQEQPWHPVSYTWATGGYVSSLQPDAAQGSSAGVYRALAWSE